MSHGLIIDGRILFNVGQQERVLLAGELVAYDKYNGYA